MNLNTRTPNNIEKKTIPKMLISKSKLFENKNVRSSMEIHE